MITSTQNNFIKQVRKLHKRKERNRSKQFLVEGYHLIEEAVKSDWQVDTLLVNEGVTVPKWCENIDTIQVTDAVFEHISQTETPQGIAAIINMTEIDLELTDKVLLIDAVQDPGNLGTIIRTADAAGFNSVVLGKGTVDMYNDKVIRATQGSLFHIQVKEQDLREAIDLLQEKEFTVYASALENAKPYKDIKPKEKLALIMGNEGSGISDELLQKADERIHIPIYGEAESLNVAIAAGILMYAFT